MKMCDKRKKSIRERGYKRNNLIFGAQKKTEKSTTFPASRLVAGGRWG
mgnify:CR=1 FL=1